MPTGPDAAAIIVSTPPAVFKERMSIAFRPDPNQLEEKRSREREREGGKDGRRMGSGMREGRTPSGSAMKRSENTEVRKRSRCVMAVERVE